MAKPNDPIQTVAPVTDEKILRYREVLDGKIKDAESVVSVKSSEFNNSLCDEVDTRDLYDFFHAGKNKYNALKECTVSPVAKSIAELLKDLEDDYAGTLKKSLDEKMTIVSKDVKDFGTKTKAVHEAYCKVDAEYKTQCNSGVVDILRNSITDALCEDREPAPGFDPLVNLLCKDVEELVKCNASLENNMVKASSVNALCDLTGLIDAVSTLKGGIDKVYKDVCDNAESKDKKAKETFDKLIKTICDVSIGSAGERAAVLNSNALRKMCQFIMSCKVDDDKTWKTIEDDINKCLCITKPGSVVINPDC